MNVSDQELVTAFLQALNNASAAACDSPDCPVHGAKPLPEPAMTAGTNYWYERYLEMREDRNFWHQLHADLTGAMAVHAVNILTELTLHIEEHGETITQVMQAMTAAVSAGVEPTEPLGACACEGDLL